MEQIVHSETENYDTILKFLRLHQTNRIMVVCGNSFFSQKICEDFTNLEKQELIKIIYFTDFTPNPTYEAVVEGTKIFIEEECQVIIAVGGGSAIDVAKCIKLFAVMDSKEDYLLQELKESTIPFLAMPTTAGTGSESTKFSVIYKEGKKLSIEHESELPEIVLLDSTMLSTLPMYHRKATMLDALCHAIESYWSVYSNEKSKEHASKAIRMILENKEAYLKNYIEGNKKMLLAANLAGRAINITKTTAGHAMCYKITGIYGYAHGHAAALCVNALWPYMLQSSEKCIDKRGRSYFYGCMTELGRLMGGKSAMDGAILFSELFESLELSIPMITEEDMKVLVDAVNTERLKNHPIALNKKSITALYRNIGGKNEG